MVKTLGKVAVAVGFGLGAGIAGWLAGVMYGASGAVAMYRSDEVDPTELEEAVDHMDEAMTHLGEEIDDMK